MPPSSSKRSRSSVTGSAAHDHELLAGSLRRFLGGDVYDLAALQADLARFAFLLGDDGERFFGPDQQ
jgi:hypothetical protein